MVPGEGFEPPTFGLQIVRTAPQMLILLGF
jgi:hypothetical protein